MATHTFTEEEYTGRLSWRLWRRLLGRMLEYRRYAIPLAACSMGLAAVEASFTLVTRAAIDTALAGRSAALAGYLWIFAAMAVAFTVGVWGFITLAGRISTHVSHDIRRDAFARLQELSFSYYDRRPVGWLMARLTSDCQRLSHVLSWGLMDVLWGACLMVGIVVVLLWMHWRLAMIVFAVVPPLVLASIRFQRLMLHSSRQVRKANSQITAAYNEGIAGVRTTKTLVREEANLGEFEHLSATMYAQSVRNAIYSAVYFPVVVTLGAAGAGLALWFGGQSVLAGVLSAGTLVAFLAYAGQFFQPIHEIARVFSNLQAAQASAERVVDLLDTQPEIRDAPEVHAAIAAQAARPRAPGVAIDGGPERIETIEFRDVGFGYKDGQKVLEGFHLRVRAGQTVALVGPTGGGKTTVVSLLCRFYEPTAGEVLLNGTDYRRRSLHWLQGQLGIVLQTPHLFSGTIRENIRYGRLEAGDEEVMAAARLVSAHEFITEAPQGYDTEVGEGGGRLSMGQKQLLSFARAVLADPQVFVMDEATSSIDTQAEQLIQRALATMLRGRTSFIIAHRLSTIRSADRILVIEAGRITEDGTHRELLARRGHYYELYTNQFTHERAEAVLEEA